MGQSSHLPLVVVALAALASHPTTAAAEELPAPVSPAAAAAAISGEQASAAAGAAVTGASEQAAAQPAAVQPAPAEEKKAEDPKPAPAAEEKKADEKKPEPKKDLLKTPTEPPAGFAGRSRVKAPAPQETDHFVPVPDRWRIGFPDYQRYKAGLGSPFKRGAWWDPYNQNVFKGDYPIRGQKLFLNLSLDSDTFTNFVRLPTPSGVSSAGPGRFRFFGNGDRTVVDQTLFLSMDLFHGDTSFKPRDWAFRLTPAFNVNYLHARQTGVADIDVRDGITRIDPYFSFQELFAERKIADLSANYDFLSMRAGIQNFSSDFRGFLFIDNAPGLRLFGNTEANRNQFNLAYFRPLQKDTYSRLNRIFRDREQDVVVANFYRQDLFRPGYTGQFTVAYNSDQGDRFFDNNGRQVRPPLVGLARPHTVRALYLGLNGDGHVGRLNVTHSFYQALGRDSRNPISRQISDINAQFAAAEVSYDKDWLRLRSAAMYASGDRNPLDNSARGFDSIFDNPLFAGGGFSFFQSQSIGLSGTGLEMVGDGTFLPALRSSRLEGQPNFVNPGLLLFNVGADADLTPKWRVSANINWLNFQRTQPLELVLNQSNINRSIGIDYSLGFKHRPFLNDNVIFTFGVSALVPGSGFKDIHNSKTLFAAFGRLNLKF